MLQECFHNPDMELYQNHTLDHMSTLWENWRSNLNVKNVKPCKTRADALKNVPGGMDCKDWEWLVTNKFLDKKFLV